MAVVSATRIVLARPLVMAGVLGGLFWLVGLAPAASVVFGAIVGIPLGVKIDDMVSQRSSEPDEKTRELGFTLFGVFGIGLGVAAALIAADSVVKRHADPHRLHLMSDLPAREFLANFRGRLCG